MRSSPWLMLKQAHVALAEGRPDEAHRLIAPLLDEGHRKAVRLAGEIAGAHLAAGEKALRADDTDAAWSHLVAAEGLHVSNRKAAALRQSLTRLALAECRAALEAAHPMHAIEAIERLRNLQAASADFDSIEQAAQDWVLSMEMADRGDFLLAGTTIERVRPRLGAIPVRGLDHFLQRLHERHENYRSAVAELGEAREAGDWNRAAEWAARVVAVAPAHREARNLQVRAWEQVQPLTMPYQPEAELVQLKPATNTLKRFLLWIDGVGGFLVCLAPRVTFGQAIADAPIDIPLLADLSRLHGEISRDGEGYVFESNRGALVNSTPITRTTLKPGDRVTLGATCQFVFHQPLAISPSARLELVSGHRLKIAVDGVLLMAETLLLGPPGQGHVVVPWLPQAIVLYRSKDGIGVRIPGEFRVDSKLELNRAMLPLPSVVSSEHLHFAVEAVGARF